MNQDQPRRLKLGENIEGIVVKATGGRRFLVQAKAAPRDWKVELHTLRAELVEPGQAGTFWIGRITPAKKEILVHDGDFGRLPISTAMAKRYEDGLAALLGEAELNADNIADARSMIERTESRKTADWLSCWQLIGEPEPGWAKELLAAIDRVRFARKSDENDLPLALKALRESFGPQLEEALRGLRK